MKTNLVFMTLVISMLIFISCEKKVDTSNINLDDIIGKWESDGYAAGGLIDDNGNRYILDSVGDWFSRLELYIDSTCYYMEYKEYSDTFTVVDTGTFYLKNDWLYLQDIKPVYIGFGDPIGGEVEFKSLGMFLNYKIQIPEIGVDANISRRYYLLEE